VVDLVSLSTRSSLSCTNTTINTSSSQFPAERLLFLTHYALYGESCICICLSRAAVLCFERMIRKMPCFVALWSKLTLFKRPTFSDISTIDRGTPQGYFVSDNKNRIIGCEDLILHAAPAHLCAVLSRLLTHLSYLLFLTLATNLCFQVCHRKFYFLPSLGIYLPCHMFPRIISIVKHKMK
jgi:hypothetical protein